MAGGGRRRQEVKRRKTLREPSTDWCSFRNSREKGEDGGLQVRTELHNDLPIVEIRKTGVIWKKDFTKNWWRIEASAEQAVEINFLEDSASFSGQIASTDADKG